jgi:hypothetical protein
MLRRKASRSRIQLGLVVCTAACRYDLVTLQILAVTRSARDACALLVVSTAV